MYAGNVPSLHLLRRVSPFPQDNLLKEGIGDNWYRRGRLEHGPAMTAMVEDEFEHTVSIGSAE
jgi:hypothetical protein